jgi:hypothetical protein
MQGTYDLDILIVVQGTLVYDFILFMLGAYDLDILIVVHGFNFFNMLIVINMSVINFTRV